mgnify:CR=1 FL=1
MQKYSGLNYTMLCDFYELTMGNGYFEAGLKDKITYFDLFYRTVPDGGGFAIAAGLEQAIDYIRNLHFSEEDIDYLRGRGMFSEAFLDYLRHFKFTGDVWAMPEGTPVFPREPIMVIRAPAIQAQLLETFLLLTINHQSLIATKANRIVRAADGRVVLEFGSRRAQGPDAAVLGARAAFIGGCAGTACVLSDQSTASPRAAPWPTPGCRCSPRSWTLPRLLQDLPAERHPACGHLRHPAQRRAGCHPRFQRGLEASRHYEMRHTSRLRRHGLSHQARPQNARRRGLARVQDHLLQLPRRTPHKGAAPPGRLHRLLRRRREAHNQPHLPRLRRVYKLAAVEEDDGSIVPRIKISENVGKITNPHFKKVYRFYGRDTGMAEADYICLYNDSVDDTKDLVIRDPDATWKQKTMTNFKARELLVPIFKGGELVYKQPSLPEIQAYCRREVATLWPEVLRFDYPHNYYVDLSDELLEIKTSLLNARR